MSYAKSAIRLIVAAIILSIVICAIWLTRASAPPAAHVSSAHTGTIATLPENSTTPPHIVLGLYSVYLNGQPTDWQAVRKLLESIPRSERRATMIQFGLCFQSNDPKEFLTAKNEVEKLADEMEFAGVEPVTEETPPAPEIGTYTMSGKVQRPGKYAAGLRRISLKQAMIGAGTAQADTVRLLATVTRHWPGPEAKMIVRDLSVGDLFAGQVADVELRPGDDIDVRDKDEPSTSRPTSARSSPKTATTAATQSRQVIISPVREEDLKPGTRSYAIAVNDLLSIHVAVNDNSPEVAMNHRVDEKGNITMNNIKMKLHVLGLTTDEASQLVANGYRDSGVAPDATVEVNIKEARGRTFLLLSNFAVPGEHPIDRDDLRLSEAIHQGQGIIKGNKVRVTRRAEPPGVRVLEIDLSELAKTDSKVDIVIRPGDVIQVIDADRK